MKIIEQNNARLVIRLLTVILLSATSVLAQSKNRIVEWSESPINDRNTRSSGDTKVLPQIEALQINDITVDGKSITIGQFFAADDDWLKSLSLRVKNISSLSISAVQMTLMLPEIMPGGPAVILCFGCGPDAKPQKVMPGEEFEVKCVLYNWLTDRINAKSSLSKITKARIDSVIVTLADSRKWISGCVKTANLQNACPVAVR